MKQLLADLENWRSKGESVVLATLVRVRGSSPRGLGARAAVTGGGAIVGSVSGGCVESDLFDRAMEVLESGQALVASYGLTTEADLELGLSCGSIEVLVEAFTEDPCWRTMSDALAERRPVALAVAFAPPSLIGRRLSVLDDGSVAGSIDDRLDQRVIAEASGMLGRGGAATLDLESGGDGASVLVEVFRPPPRLFIIGATDTARYLCRMAKDLGYYVIVVDARAAFARAERFPEADELRRLWPQEVLEKAELDERSYVVVLSHDSKFDLPALACALRSQAAYIGALGSRRTQERRSARLREEGFGDVDLARIRGPVGLDIGAREPAEIALAILAELLALGNGRDGRALVEKRGAINDVGS
ncbi:MAG: XdhC family protein [Candidatus Binatia bacterium]